MSEAKRRPFCGRNFDGRIAPKEYFAAITAGSRLMAKAKRF